MNNPLCLGHYDAGKRICALWRLGINCLNCFVITNQVDCQKKDVYVMSMLKITFIYVISFLLLDNTCKVPGLMSFSEYFCNQII